VTTNENVQHKIDTMTLIELTQKLRALGMKVSQATLADGIEQGVYPFAICIRRKNRVFEIYTALVDKWIEERLCSTN
jgi:antitoxin component of RelBE/YafQ-DinJ toxin-antitoxin module